MVYSPIYASAGNIDSKNTIINKQENDVLKEDGNISDFEEFDDLPLK